MHIVDAGCRGGDVELRLLGDDELASEDFLASDLPDVTGPANADVRVLVEDGAGAC